MAAPKSTIWELLPHTRAKHEILRRYLQAWTPILTHGRFREIVYIDGFAGPGRYSKGEEGSPLIALRTALEYKVPEPRRLLFLLIERDPERAAILREVIHGIERPDNYRVKVAEGSFEEGVNWLLDFYKSRHRPLPPTFAFVDPFGWTGAPFRLIADILKHPSCEVLVNFMFEEVNRFLGHESQPDNFDAFFGSSVWRECLSKSGGGRNRCLHDLYVSQLRRVGGAKYVRSFEMKNESGLTDYYLFHATNSLRGLQKMKEAMWKVDPVGEFTFRDATDPNQLVMFGEPQFHVLREQIVRRFAGQETAVEEVEEFVLAETAFRETHYKQQVLADLEKAVPPGLEVLDAKPGRRRGTFGDPSMRLRFT